MNTKHLKAKILDLAIRGKLVLQDPSEGNAADLLKKIREEKNILIEQKKIKADKNSSFIIKAEDGRHYEHFDDGNLIDIEDEIPFEIPENWCWCRLREIGTWQSGCTPDKSRKDFYDRADIPWLNSGDLTDGYIENIPHYVSRIAFNEKKMKLNDAGSVCIAMYGATIGKLGILTKPATTNQAVLVCSKLHLSDSKYLFYFLKSHKKEYIQAGFGGAQPNISKEKVEPTLFPLPPLEEQKRIVSAIEKAFEQIDIIEKNKLNLKTYIKQTKSKVLDLAIHGKLVEQNPGEGNAFELLEKIRKEKSELIKQNKIKEDKKSSFIIKAEDGKHYEHFIDGTLKDIEEEIPFEEPKGWTWCRINEIAVDMADGPFGSNLKSEHYTANKEARIIQLSNLSDEGWREENTRYTTIKHATENISRSIVEPGNIVIAKMMPAGRAMICPDKEQMYVLSSDCVKLVPIEGVYKQFLVRALNSPFFRNRVVDNVQGVTRQRTSISKLRSCYFPLPPFEEQKRIVDKLEQVFKQLDILEKSLGE